jgi:alkylhydroperoxidase family enzyme
MHHEGRRGRQGIEVVSFLSFTEYESASPEVRREYDDQVAKHGRMTNMKRTLLHSVPAFKAYMEWYTLRDLIAPFIGERGVVLYSYAISYGNRCLVCSLFFRKVLVDWGEDPERPVLSDDERLLVDLGGGIAKDPHAIPEEIYARLSARYTEEQRVLLVAFAGIMAATNLFNTVAKVPLDEVLVGYRTDAIKEEFEHGR